MADYDREIVNLAQQILGQRKPKVSPPLELEVLPAEPQLPEQPAPEAPLQEPETTIEASSTLVGVAAVSEPPQAPVVAVNGLPNEPVHKEIRTAAELAQMIEAGLARHPHCPRRGFEVTVYGATPWRAMLLIKPAAGPVRNPQEWRDLTEQLAERLRGQYDLSWR